jgi:hypothetical protein
MNANNFKTEVMDSRFADSTYGGIDSRTIATGCQYSNFHKLLYV